MSNKFIKKRFEFFALCLILIFAIFIRLLFFVGFGLGDDSYYASMSKTFMERGFNSLYLEFGSNYRIGLWVPISFFFKILGISNISFVLFSFLTSIGLIIIVYLIGKELFNGKVGLIAAFFITIVPFDSVFASSMTIDIPSGFLLALSFLLFIKGNKSSRFNSIVYYSAASLCLIWSYFIKIPSVFMVFVFPLISLINFKKIKKHFIFYIILSGLFLTSFIIDYSISRDPLHYLHQELKYGPKPSQFKYIWDWYPKWMFTREMSFNILLFGYFFYVSVFAIVYCLVKRIKESHYLLIWFFTIFVLLEFLPMGINPYMVAPRFFRYTYAFFVPATLISAMALYSIWKSSVRKHPALIKILFALFFFILTYTSLIEGSKLANIYKDSFSDSREAAIFISKLEPKAIYADNSMLDRFNFYTVYERTNQTFLSFSIDFQKEIVEGKNYSALYKISDGYAVLGGARSPDISPIFVLNSNQFEVPKNWILIKEIEREKEFYRAENLKIYQIFKIN